MDKIEKSLINLIKHILEKNYSLNIENLKLLKPPKEFSWDFSFNTWFLSSYLKKDPKLICTELKNFIDSLKQDNLEKEYEAYFNLIDETEVSWIYLNIKIVENLFLEEFLKPSNFFSETRLKNSSKNIVIDYIWANVWKPLHIWHICTPNQGETMANIYKYLWYNVITDSHIWDWGIIFWKLIFGYKKWWDENKLKQNAVDYLLELYVKSTAEAEKDILIEERFREEFRLLSQGNKDSIKLWNLFTKESIESMNTQLFRLNVKPNFNIWESFYEWLNLPKMENYPDLEYNMKEIVLELIEKWIAKKNQDNSVWIEFPENTKIPSCILQKRDWTHWYLASDLACIKYRMANWQPEHIIYFVDSRQKLHLSQAFEISKMAWWLEYQDNSKQNLSTNLFHAYNWFISLKDWAMSTRKWKIIKLSKLLDEAEDRAKKIILEKRSDISWSELEKISKIIASGAIKYWYLKKSRETDVVFDWDDFMNFEWNSWPYIQYAYVRSKRIFEKEPKILKNFDISNLKIAKESLSLIKILLKYNSSSSPILETIIKNMPHILASYSYELTKSFNNFYNNVEILNEKNSNLRNLYLLINKSFLETIEKCFELLGISMPEKM